MSTHDYETISLCLILALVWGVLTVALPYWLPVPRTLSLVIGWLVIAASTVALLSVPEKE